MSSSNETSPHQPSTLPTASGTAPPVVGWYKAYAAFMCVFYMACTALGFFLLSNSSLVLANVRGLTPAELQIRAVILIVLGIVLLIAYVSALILPNSPRVWSYHAILIGLNLGNCCLWIATIPLMIAWLKPQTQQYFGRPDPLAPRQNDLNLPPPTPRT